MATQTEQDPINPTSSIEEVKVIAVKLPFDLQERILSFPVLHKLREDFPKAELHFITPNKDIEVLNLLPFTAYYHEYDETEITSVFDVHRFTASAKIYNVDLFISLTNSFADACLGVGLRAKKRVGFSDGWKTMVLTHKTPRLSGHHISEDYFSLYRTLQNGNVDPKLTVMSRDLSPVIPDWDSLPYIGINLSPLRDTHIEREMVDLINSFENQRIVLFASEDQEKIKILIEPFLAQLSKKNTYIDFVLKSWIDLAKMMAFSRGVITFNGPLASLSAYVGTRTIILYDSEDPKKHAPFCFLAEILILGVNDPTLVHSSKSTGALKERKRFDMSEVFGKAFDFFKLVIK